MLPQILLKIIKIELEKNFFTDQEDGELVSLNCFRNVKDEAVEIGANIEDLQKKILVKQWQFL